MQFETRSRCRHTSLTQASCRCLTGRKSGNPIVGIQGVGGIGRRRPSADACARQPNIRFKWHRCLTRGGNVPLASEPEGAWRGKCRESASLGAGSVERWLAQSMLDSIGAEPIRAWRAAMAIIGIACRFPCAWAFARSARNATTRPVIRAGGDRARRATPAHRATPRRGGAACRS